MKSDDEAEERVTVSLADLLSYLLLGSMQSTKRTSEYQLQERLVGTVNQQQSTGLYQATFY